MGGVRLIKHQQHALTPIVPHPRTLRKAREQVKQMVIDGTSTRRIRNYLDRFVVWWVHTSGTWAYQELLEWFLDVCWQQEVAAYAAGLSQLHLNKSPLYATRMMINAAA